MQSLIHSNIKRSLNTLQISVQVSTLLFLREFKYLLAQETYSPPKTFWRLVFPFINNSVFNPFVFLCLLSALDLLKLAYYQYLLFINIVFISIIQIKFIIIFTKRFIMEQIWLFSSSFLNAIASAFMQFFFTLCKVCCCLFKPLII